jgi:thiamine kinase-like enzyme
MLPYLQDLSAHFGETNIHSTELKGGFSSSKNYLLEVNREKYVLRVFSGTSSTELAAALAAAQQGISPRVFWVARDKGAYLMQYIQDDHLTLKRAKMKETICVIARSFQKIHALDKSGIPHRSLIELTRTKYQELQQKGFASRRSDEIWEALYAFYQRLVPNPREFVVIHGDLTPRNAFFDGEHLIVIDWDEANTENLFYDLSLFAILHDYAEEEEALLLLEYFGKPASLFWEEYEFFKRVNLFKMFVDCILFAQHLAPEITQTNQEKLESWSSYIERFENPKDPLSASFFYDWGQAAIQQLY